MAHDKIDKIKEGGLERKLKLSQRLAGPGIQKIEYRTMSTFSLNFPLYEDFETDLGYFLAKLLGSHANVSFGPQELQLDSRNLQYYGMFKSSSNPWIYADIELTRSEYRDMPGRHYALSFTVFCGLEYAQEVGDALRREVLSLVSRYLQKEHQPTEG